MLSVPKRSTDKSFEGAAKILKGLERCVEYLVAAAGAVVWTLWFYVSDEEGEIRPGSEDHTIK